MSSGRWTDDLDQIVGGGWMRTAGNWMLDANLGRLGPAVDCDRLKRGA